MTNQQNIATAQQKFIIQIDDKTLKRIKPHDRAELVNAYLQLFSGFSWVNWTNGHSLGRAWQTAITQCGAFCESKNKKNPAAKYLNAAYNGHKKYWSQIIMTHKNRENTINQKDEHIKKLREHGMRMIRQAMDKINLILARYNEYTLEINRSTTAEMETPSAPHTNQSQNNNSQSQNPHTPAQQGLPKTDATRPAPEHAMAQKQAQTAEIAQQKQQPQKVAEPQRMTQPTQQKQPYVQPMATIVRPVQPKKTYAAPEMSVRENQFAKSVQQTKTEPKATKFVAAQMQIKRQINIFAFKNFNQRAA